MFRPCHLQQSLTRLLKKVRRWIEFSVSELELAFQKCVATTSDTHSRAGEDVFDNFPLPPLQLLELNGHLRERTYIAGPKVSL